MGWRKAKQCMMGWRGGEEGLEASGCAQAWQAGAREGPIGGSVGAAARALPAEAAQRARELQR